MEPKIANYFKKVDPRLYAALQEIPDWSELSPTKNSNHFKRLCRIIIGQQLSGSAANSIWNRFEVLFLNKRVSAKRTLEYTDTQLRNTGMAYAKVRAIRDLATKVATREINLKKMEKVGIDEVRTELIAVRGVGPWTIEMFLMFSLGYEDLFSYGDLGLRKGVQKIYKLKNKPTDGQLDRITKKWSPYRTYAARILWRYLDIK